MTTNIYCRKCKRLARQYSDKVCYNCGNEYGTV